MKITFKSALCVFLITLSQALTHAVYAHDDTRTTLPASALSVNNIIESLLVEEGQSGRFTVHNLYGVGDLLKGIRTPYKQLTLYLTPAEILPAVDLSQLSEDEKNDLFKNFPHISSDIRDASSPLVLQIFTFISSAFGKKGGPVFLYVTRPANDDEPTNKDWKETLSGLNNTLNTLRGKFSNIKKTIIMTLGEVGPMDSVPSANKNMLDIHYNNLSTNDRKLFPNIMDYYKFFADHGIRGCRYRYAALLWQMECDTEACKWFTKSAKQEECEESFHTLGMMYVYGTGVKKSKEHTFSNFKKAAERGHRKSQGNIKSLGDAGDKIGQFYYAQLLYTDCEHIPEDRFEATILFIKSARQGHLPAKWALHDLMPQTFLKPDTERPDDELLQSE